jgi:hypothetical protein
MPSVPYWRRLLCSLLLPAAFLVIPAAVFGQDNPSSKGKDLYDRIKAFTLSGPVAVKELGLKRDRAEMVFNGTFYFAAPVDGHVTAPYLSAMADLRPRRLRANLRRAT